MIRAGSLAIAADSLQSQVGTAQGGFDRQVGIRIRGHTLRKDFLGALAGLFRAGHIDLLDVLGGICQDGDELRLDLRHAACDGEDLSSPCWRTLMNPNFSVVSSGA